MDLATVHAPVDLALLGSIEEIAQLPADQQPAYITAALVESRKWLHLATESTNPRPFAEIKAWAASIAEYARQKGLASEIVADGQEMLRRAERAVGQAVRNGQEAGEVRRKGDKTHAGPYTRVRLGNVETIQPHIREPKDSLPSPGSFFNHDGSAWSDSYAMAAVPGEHFEAALTEARSEGNLSRANVVRKVKGQAPPQTRDARADLIADLAGKGNAAAQMVRHVGVAEETIRQIARDYGIEIPAENVVGRSRRLDSVRVTRDTVLALEGIAASIALINFEALADLDPSEARQWTASLDSSIRALSRFFKSYKEAVQ